MAGKQYIHLPTYRQRDREDKDREREQEQAQASMGPEDTRPTGQVRPRHPIAHSRHGLVTQNQESNEFKHLESIPSFQRKLNMGSVFLNYLGACLIKMVTFS